LLVAWMLPRSRNRLVAPEIYGARSRFGCDER
jgi:hypothetical protein